MLIRTETNKDFDEVYSVVKAAFAVAEHSDGNEHDLVVALRKSEAFVPALSLVAEDDDGKIVGHIMFTTARIGNCVELALAPLAVLPGNQKKGVGTALIREGHRIAKALGYQYSVVIGSEKYYPRSGYVQAKEFGIQAPFEISDENFMAIRLQENAKPICGVIQYAPEFGV